jgi:hypothetical protein
MDKEFPIFTELPRRQKRYFLSKVTSPLNIKA